MSGEDIIARTNSVATRGMGKPFKHDREWQYHSRSDRHSKTACWAVLFDLLQATPLMREHAETGKIGIGINFPVEDPARRKTKNLDLVIQKIDPTQPPPIARKGPKNFVELGQQYQIVLTPTEQVALDALPTLSLLTAPDATVLLAIEAKAAMTEHIKSKPRLYDELNSSHSQVHNSQVAGSAISAGYVIINTSPTFISPSRNDRPLTAEHPNEVSAHRPDVALKLAEHLATLPIAAGGNAVGFDALGMSMMMCANDGTPIAVDRGVIAPNGFRYDQFIRKLDLLYATRFNRF